MYRKLMDEINNNSNNNNNKKINLKYIKKKKKWTNTSAAESHRLVKQGRSDKQTGRRKF